MKNKFFSPRRIRTGGTTDGTDNTDMECFSARSGPAKARTRVTLAPYIRVISVIRG